MIHPKLISVTKFLNVEIKLWWRLELNLKWFRTLIVNTIVCWNYFNRQNPKPWQGWNARAGGNFEGHQKDLNACRSSELLTQYTVTRTYVPRLHVSCSFSYVARTSIHTFSGDVRLQDNFDSFDYPAESFDQGGRYFYITSWLAAIFIIY